MGHSQNWLPYGFRYDYPPWTMLTLGLSRNATAISSLTMSISVGGSPPTLGPRGVGGQVPLCWPLAHGYSKCMFGVRPVPSSIDLYLFDSLGTEQYREVALCGYNLPQAEWRKIVGMNAKTKGKVHLLVLCTHSRMVWDIASDGLSVLRIVRCVSPDEPRMGWGFRGYTQTVRPHMVPPGLLVCRSMWGQTVRQRMLDSSCSGRTVRDKAQTVRLCLEAAAC